MSMVITHIRPHDEAVIELLRADPEFASEYVSAALDEADQPGGQEALLTALRRVVEARGVAQVARASGVRRESIYRALATNGNPTMKTLFAVLQATGLKLGVHRA